MASLVDRLLGDRGRGRGEPTPAGDGFPFPEPIPAPEPLEFLPDQPPQPLAQHHSKGGHDDRHPDNGDDLHLD